MSKVYEIVTERILATLESGTVPWMKPWTTHAPRNVVSKKRYNGINVILLGMSGHESPFWGTYKNWQEKGGQVRKGEKGTLVVYFNFVKKKDNEDEMIPLLRYYTLFNADQVDGVELPELPKNDHTDIVDGEKVINDYVKREEIALTHGFDSAFYTPGVDQICLPAKESFVNSESYYATAFHEIGHSTGHKNRLNREGITKSDGFGGHTYGREELVAEMTSAFLMAECGIENEMDQSAAYLASWIKTIRDDAKMVVWAAGRAQKATDYVLDREADNDS